MASKDSGKELLLPYTSDRSSFSQSDGDFDEQTEKATSYEKRVFSLKSLQPLVFHSLILATYTMLYAIAWLKTRHSYLPAETPLVYSKLSRSCLTFTHAEIL